MFKAMVYSGKGGQAFSSRILRLLNSFERKFDKQKCRFLKPMPAINSDNYRRFQGTVLFVTPNGKTLVLWAALEPQ